MTKSVHHQPAQRAFLRLLFCAANVRDSYALGCVFPVEECDNKGNHKANKGSLVVVKIDTATRLTADSVRSVGVAVNPDLLPTFLKVIMLIDSQAAT